MWTERTVIAVLQITGALHLARAANRANAESQPPRASVTKGPVSAYAEMAQQDNDANYANRATGTTHATDAKLARVRKGFSVGVGCNPLTGQCSCLPGVVGANCDGCPYRWVLIEGYGCQECEECVHALLDTTDELIRLIEPTILEFKTAAHSYFLHQSLSAINSTVHELRPRVDLMDLPQAETHPIHTAIEDVFKTAQSISGKANILYDRADEASTNSFAVFNDALAVQKHVDDAFSSARSVIGEINRLVMVWRLAQVHNLSKQFTKPKTLWIGCDSAISVPFGG
ncbi:laminin subunit alpha-like [Macrobrachium nipponense]|uniref:laminin subunit alpha-like n=1 Tax=Macrobrachium nipponense TaxID=159736 RepID=UPI0030C8731C